MRVTSFDHPPLRERRERSHTRLLRRQQRYLLAVLLVAAALLLGLALLSYTPEDQDNAALRWSDLVGLIRGEPEARLKAETTHNWLGLLGALIAHVFVALGIGYASLVLPLLMGWWAWEVAHHEVIPAAVWRRSLAILLLAVLGAVGAGSLRGIPAFAELPLEWSGMLGTFVAVVLGQLLGTVGAIVLVVAAVVAVLIVEFPRAMEQLFQQARLLRARWRDRRQRSQQERRQTAPSPPLQTERGAAASTDEPARIVRVRTQDATVQPGMVPEATSAPIVPMVSAASPGSKAAQGTPGASQVSSTTPVRSPREQSKGQAVEASSAPVPLTVPEELSGYMLPPSSLLLGGEDALPVDEAELQRNARLLQEKLETFRIGIENLVVTPGPVVTQYEFVPAAGVKVSQIESLADDIALALKAPGVRIIAPVPGRGTVAVEIPNHRRALVRFRSIVESPAFQHSEAALPLGLGVTITGAVYCADLARMPHLLIAGATGSGKSVGLNTMILSLLFRLRPWELKFVIIDPKKVELTPYGMLEHHFLAISPDVGEPIVTSPAAAVTVLKAVELEMERRYDLLAQAGQRNIVDYNRRVQEGKLGQQCRPLPYIVVVIDELADLMLTAARAVEEPITRLAQLARAVGIHLLVATQRPSVDVITGLIKANFPARIAYQVASRVDSRVILDMAGAEQLLGSGDMLFLPGGLPKPIRLQNAYVSTEEVEAVCNFIAQQPGFPEPYLLPTVSERAEGENKGGTGGRDPLFAEAARLVVRHQQGSVSLLQRRLKVGYSRAARIMDELEAAGIVGPADGSRARTVLLRSESELEGIL